MRAGNGELSFRKSRLVSSPRLFVTWCWTEEAMIAGSRDVGVSPSIVGSFSRKEAALVEVYPQGRMSHHFREMCVGDHLAVKFEWAWQHPRESRVVREAAAAFKSFPGLARKIKLAYTMLTLPAWNR
ncbi:hypothetical protein Bca101_032652 [Brassica carinata]